MTIQQIESLLEEIHGIGNRECQPTPDQAVRLCAALLFMHALVLNNPTAKTISTMNIYGSMAVKNIATLLYDFPITRVIEQIKEGIAREDIRKRLG